MRWEKPVCFLQETATFLFCGWAWYCSLVLFKCPYWVDMYFPVAFRHKRTGKNAPLASATHIKQMSAHVLNSTLPRYFLDKRSLIQSMLQPSASFCTFQTYSTTFLRAHGIYRGTDYLQARWTSSRELQLKGLKGQIPQLMTTMWSLCWFTAKYVIAEIHGPAQSSYNRLPGCLISFLSTQQLIQDST